MPKAKMSEQLIAEWHPTKNTLLEDTTSVNKKVWWLGKECGHEWESRIAHRINGSGCPYCSGNKILPGFNDLKTTHPKIADQWHPTKNVLSPTEVSSTRNQKVWWQCEKNHEWQQSILTRSRNLKCPVCAGTLILENVNDFLTTHPHIAAEWHPTRNTLPPTQISYGSGKKVWWLGKECGHEWQATVHSRTGKDHTGCLVCSNRVVKPGINDFATTNKEIISQWHPTKNLPLTPESISKGVKDKIWWVCPQKHQWKAALYNRTGKSPRGCPYCVNKISKAEKDIADFLSKKIKIERNCRSVLSNSNYELDIFVPEKNIAIEFNGLYWHDENHKSKTYHYDKWLACKEKGIQLIQIWEDEWNSNPEQIKSMLAHKLGVSERTKISGKKTRIIELTTEQTSKFLDQNHIQGYVQGSVRIGLIQKGTDALVAVMVLKSEPNSNGKVLNLLRFATSATVQGGFTKLLKHVENTHAPNSIVTFSDNCVSDGRLYENNGFIMDDKINPDYMYVVGRERVHKFNYRLKRFKQDPTLDYKEGLSEHELALLNNLPRIWDAGKVKWRKKFN